MTPVANGLDVVLTGAECPNSMTKLVAVKPVTSLLGSFDEHEMF